MTNLLRLEGLCFGAAALMIYWLFGFSWWVFLGLILVPDISMIGYLRGARFGAICYNVVHTTIGPWLVLLAYGLIGNKWALAIALIWFAHIGIDRALGYGLKLKTDFKDTHLGRIGT